MARCKVYEIKGPDPARVAGAERCARDSVGETKERGRKYRICRYHQSDRWTLFVHDDWLYAFDPSGPDPKKKRKK